MLGVAAGVTGAAWIHRHAVNLEACLVLLQVLRGHRGFTATLFSPQGELIMKITRPFYVISSSLKVEDQHGEVVGEVQQRWHLFRRNYDMYLGKDQFAEIRGGFLAWEFDLIDQEGVSVAKVDRNFTGLAREMFTDAGQYVVYFDPAGQAQVALQASAVAKPRTHLSFPFKPPQQQLDGVSPAPSPVAPAVLSDAMTGHSATHLADLQPSWDQGPIASGRLGISERAIALAAAISIDYDYFSRVSSSGHAPFIMPMPMPVPSNAPHGDATDPAATGTAGAGAVGGTSSDTTTVGESGSNQAAANGDLGGDEFIQPADGGWGGQAQPSGNQSANSADGGESHVDDDPFDDDDDDEDGGGVFGILKDIFMNGD
ncbi:hypothetical protein CYMTET_13478 [Cymbomonas tetramitiformis]|uniref:Phospholipid scramblase n=1 Tax=Cymbomonas tetramitiformis TaxID=36881 RepID=A0AAE0GI26_9CHLO|nr:hypothetical protein CYMTET_13478 [Cymbomonas tetramitiformis]KAK3278595.1 hypothetical protein CYMTET_13478 [Cymbomonas tetramitiformis]